MTPVVHARWLPALKKRPKRRARTILSKRYEVFIGTKRTLRRPHVWRGTEKREAIRASHRWLRQCAIGSQVSVRTLEGALIYQAHLSPLSGRIVAEEL